MSHVSSSFSPWCHLDPSTSLQLSIQAFWELCAKLGGPVKNPERSHLLSSDLSG